MDGKHGQLHPLTLQPRSVQSFVLFWITLILHYWAVEWPEKRQNWKRLRRTGSSNFPAFHVARLLIILVPHDFLLVFIGWFLQFWCYDTQSLALPYPEEEHFAIEIRKNNRTFNSLYPATEFDLVYSSIAAMFWNAHCTSRSSNSHSYSKDNQKAHSLIEIFSTKSLFPSYRKTKYNLAPSKFWDKKKLDQAKRALERFFHALRNVIYAIRF